MFMRVCIKSLEVQPSVIGYIAKALGHIGQGESQAGLRIFDLAFMCCNPEETAFLLLIRVCVLVVNLDCH